MPRAVRRTALQPLWPGGCRLVRVAVLPCPKATPESLQQFATGMLRDGAFFGKTRKTIANTVCGNVHAGMMHVYTFVTKAINVFVNRRSSVQIRQLAPAFALRAMIGRPPFFAFRFLVILWCLDVGAWSFPSQSVVKPTFTRIFSPSRCVRLSRDFRLPPAGAWLSLTDR